jgi:hypothetical protein
VCITNKMVGGKNGNEINNILRDMDKLRIILYKVYEKYISELLLSKFPLN